MPEESLWNHGFQFDAYEVEFRFSDILKGMRWHGGRPESGTPGRWLLSPAVHKNPAVSAAAQNMAPTKHIDSAWPAVGMQGHTMVPGYDVFENADGVVFEEEMVMIGGGNQGVQFFWPKGVGHGGW